MKNIFIFTFALVIFSCAHHDNSERHTASEFGHAGMDMSMGHGTDSVTDTEEIQKACDKNGWNDAVTKEQQLVINDFVGMRAHRLQHALWHAVRSGLGKAENTQVIESYGKDWSERHPLCPPPQNNADDKSKYNPVGEDFLYMHREMIHALRAEFLKKNLACVKGWSSIDELDSPKWKPPGAAHDAKTKQALDLFKSWDRYFQDRSNLKQISLSQLGWALEFTIHNNLHMRFAEDRPAPQFRSAKADDDGAQIPYNGVFAKGWKYDDPAYNWLADPYGAAVNPIFWKIHGYVDHLIDLWLEANGYKTVALDCHGASDCYQWRGTWTGSTPLMAPESSQPKGLTLANGNNADKLFNQSRLKLQLIGVVHDSDFNRMKGPIHGGQPEQNDPLSVAKQKLCESSN